MKKLASILMSAGQAFSKACRGQGDSVPCRRPQTAKSLVSEGALQKGHPARDKQPYRHSEHVDYSACYFYCIFYRFDKFNNIIRSIVTV